eukprot:5610777-Alexandrium_andersonii.AAC.1
MNIAPLARAMRQWRRAPPHIAQARRAPPKQAGRNGYARKACVAWAAFCGGFARAPLTQPQRLQRFALVCKRPPRVD